MGQTVYTRFLTKSAAVIYLPNVSMSIRIKTILTGEFPGLSKSPYKVPRLRINRLNGSTETNPE